MPFLDLPFDLHLHPDRTLRIRYERIEGDPAKPVLVFLHEGLGCVEMWKRFPQALCAATGCEALLYDRQGYGQSTPFARARTVHYLHAYALDELPAVLAAAIPERDYVIVGHSDGGSIGLIHAGERPERLRGLVTMAAHVSVEDEALQGIVVAQQAWDEGKLAGLAKYHGEKTEAVFRAWAETWRSDWFRSWNIEYLLPSIVCPTLVLQGVQDQYGTPAQVDAIVRRVPGSRGRMIDDCAHSPHLEQADGVAALIGEFVGTL
ncbi:alpha/beta hydrolase [Oxalobacteraceae bacterium OM1]|nr:alpha/beta hydrolase [Oxalobacteraceae bacterium OM1]